MIIFNIFLKPGVVGKKMIWTCGEVKFDSFEMVAQF